MVNKTLFQLFWNMKASILNSKYIVLLYSIEYWLKISKLDFVFMFSIYVLYSIPIFFLIMVVNENVFSQYLFKDDDEA